MKNATTTLDRKAEVAIVGVRMSPELEREVKTEAASRGMTIRALFEELWEDYRRRRGPGDGNGRD